MASGQSKSLETRGTSICGDVGIDRLIATMETLLIEGLEPLQNCDHQSGGFNAVESAAAQEPRCRESHIRLGEPALFVGGLNWWVGWPCAGLRELGPQPPPRECSPLVRGRRCGTRWFEKHAYMYADCSKIWLLSAAVGPTRDTIRWAITVGRVRRW